MHLTGERIKKSLSERVHRDRTGIVLHRDLFSAFLSRHVYQEVFSLQDARSEYPGSEPILVEAWKAYQQTAKRVSESESRMPDTSSERFSTKLGAVDQIANKGKKSTIHSLPESHDVSKAVS